MAAMNIFLVVTILSTFLWTKSKGSTDLLTGLFPGTHCVQRRHVHGCNGTLLYNFQPTAEVVGANDPDTRLFLYTRNNSENPEFLHECGGTLASNTYFDFNVPTEVFVHGFFDGICRTSWLREMKDELLSRRDNKRYNVIIVDWTWGNFFDGAVASAHTKVVGEQMAFVLNNIVSRGANPANIHIVGHSFGAHAAGFAGKKIPGLGRITGLDPGIPSFRFSPENERLCRGDAILVDIIHTNGGDCAFTQISTRFPWGDADFYPDGGARAPSCFSNILPFLLKGNVFYALALLFPPLCYHIQAVEYYKVTINPKDCEFIGHECSAWDKFTSGECDLSCGEDRSRCAVMGMNFAQSGYTKNASGGSRKFFLRTKNHCDYCIPEAP